MQTTQTTGQRQSGEVKAAMEVHDQGGRARVSAIAICAIAIGLGLLGSGELAAAMASSRRAVSQVLLPPPLHRIAIANGANIGPRPEPPAAFAPEFNPSTGKPLGFWTSLNTSPPFNASAGMYLLTDGRVLMEDATLTNVAWWTLTPDNTGSYIDGSWTQVKSPGPCPNGAFSTATTYAPLYYASAVLPDGRFIMIGGEYDYNYTYLSGHPGVLTDQGAIYDPVANTWTCIAPPKGWAEIGDAQSVVLPDGTFMIANPRSNDLATLNTSTNPPTFSAPFTPGGKTTDLLNDEEGWILLPDGLVLTTEVWNPTMDTTVTPALAYGSGSWSGAGTAPDPLVLISKGGVSYWETGPMMLRPDGTVFASGATGFNDIFDTLTDTWSSGPSFPMITGTFSNNSCNTVGVIEQLAEADAPAALLPDGNVLLAPAPVDDVCGWVPPTKFFEFDGTNLTQVPSSALAYAAPSYVGRLLVLPTGQVMYTNGFDYIELYTSYGAPNSSWAPMIEAAPTTVSAGGANYQLFGTQFNGISQAVTYGDDYQAATNYPLVRITNNSTGHVLYARTHDHSSMGVATGNSTILTEFDVPSNIEGGPSTLVVVANGISSAPVAISVMTPTPTATATATPTATSTATATATQTATATSTATATATPTATGSTTATATASPTATATATPTSTATPAATATATATATQTASSTSTQTATATATPTATGSATTTATATASPTATATATTTSTATPTTTATATATATSTATATVTQTATATSTATATPSESATATATSTSTLTATATATASATVTATSTRTATRTPTATSTPTQTATSTATTTATATATSTPTTTATVTPTVTPSATPTATPVPAILKIKPQSVKFGKVKMGSMSGPKTVTITNSAPKKHKKGAAAFPVVVMGEVPSPNPFRLQTDCQETLLPGQSCQVTLLFEPAATGKQTGQLVIDDNANKSPQTLTLVGDGID